MMSETGAFSGPGKVIMDTSEPLLPSVIEPTRTTEETIMSFCCIPIDTATTDRFRQIGIDDRRDPVRRRRSV
jgi:hypothetical protein